MNYKSAINWWLGRFGYRIVRISKVGRGPVKEPGTAPELMNAREAIIHQINYTNHNLYLHLKEASRVRELYYRDVMLVLDRIAHFLPEVRTKIETKHPVAVDTDDHKFPWGTMQDNTRLPRFVAACERYFRNRGASARRLTYLDLGCSGGGLVLDFLLRGHEAFGIEGSDFSQLAQRAEWRLLPGNLLTADVTKPFRLSRAADGQAIRCDVVSAWEVMEHIAEDDLPQLFENVLGHLTPEGFFVGSICLVPDIDERTGANYHRCVKPRSWWESRFLHLGMRMIDDHGFAFGDFCRGTGNGPIDENYMEHPEVGFHFVAVRK